MRWLSGLQDRDKPQCAVQSMRYSDMCAVQSMRWLSSLQDRDIELLELMEQHRQLQVSFSADDPRQVRRLADQSKPTCRQHAIDSLIHQYCLRLWPCGQYTSELYFHELSFASYTLTWIDGTVRLEIMSSRE